MALEQAQRVLNWQENLMEEEMPPAWMWPFDQQLEEWFEEVERKRKSKYGADSDDDDEPMGDMMQNEFAKGRGSGD